MHPLLAKIYTSLIEKQLNMTEIPTSLSLKMLLKLYSAILLRLTFLSIWREVDDCFWREKVQAAFLCYVHLKKENNFSCRFTMFRPE